MATRLVEVEVPDDEVTAAPEVAVADVSAVVDAAEDEAVEVPEVPLPSEPISVMSVTPAMARAWLRQYNTHNRKQKRAAAVEYANMMREGLWRWNAQPISFGCGEDGRPVLRDGQNRLIAVAASDRAQRFLVVVDPALDEDAQLTMDAGVPRMTRDNLQLLGYVNASALSGAVVIALRLARDDFPGMKLRLRSPEIVAWLRDHPEMVDHASYAASHWKKFDIAPGVLAYARWALYNVDPSAAERFFEDWRTSNTGGAGSALSVLVEKLKVLRNSQKRLDQHAQLLMIMKTWNAHVTGRPVERFQLKRDKKRLPIPRPVAPKAPDAPQDPDA